MYPPSNPPDYPSPTASHSLPMRGDHYLVDNSFDFLYNLTIYILSVKQPLGLVLENSMARTNAAVSGKSTTAVTGWKVWRRLSRALAGLQAL